MWRRLLANGSRDALLPTRHVLSKVLDGLADSTLSVDEYYDTTMSAWLAEHDQSGSFDWRCYLVKYPSLRSGLTGIYIGTDVDLGYSMCMLDATQLNGYWRDAILFSAWVLPGIGDPAARQWFIGNDSLPRFLRLSRTYTGLRNVPEGFELERPVDEDAAAVFDALCDARNDITTDGERTLLSIPQSDDGTDKVDRVVVGAALLEELAEVGL